MTEARTQVLMATFSVALCARTQALTAHQVDEMRIKAEELMDRDDPLRPHIINFATQYENLRRDPYAVRILGENLEAALRADLHPASRRTNWTEPRDD